MGAGGGRAGSMRALHRPPHTVPLWYFQGDAGQALSAAAAAEARENISDGLKPLVSRATWGGPFLIPWPTLIPPDPDD